MTFGSSIPNEPPKESATNNGTRNVQVYVVLFSAKTEEPSGIHNFPIMSEFPKVFPEDISELPLEREVEFTIDLVPRGSPMSIASYRMSLVELAEVKAQVQELPDKRFVRLSVSPWGAPY